MNSSYNIVHSTGRTVDSLCINNTDIIDMYIEATNILFEFLIQKLKDQYYEGTLSILDVISLNQCEEVEYSEACEQCGDSIYTTTWIL